VSSFTKPLILEFVDTDSPDRFELFEHFDYHVGRLNSGDVISVPAGFRTDFASVPRVFWWLVPPVGRYGKAAVIHDYLYVVKTRSRKEADKIFLEAMEVLDVPKWRRKLIYFAVRFGFPLKAILKLKFNLFLWSLGKPPITIAG
jgi:hypothetical protein